MASIRCFFFDGQAMAVIFKEGMEACVDDDEFHLGKAIGEVDLETDVREVARQYELVDEACSG